MNATIKAKWLEALRSGKYVQGKGNLFNKEDNTYCCLGVLCKVMNVPAFDTDNPHTKFVNFGGPDDFSSAGLPRSVQEEAGIFGPYGDFTYIDAEQGGAAISESLAHVNDTSGLGFPEIADLIEEYL